MELARTTVLSAVNIPIPSLMCVLNFRVVRERKRNKVSILLKKIYIEVMLSII